MFTLFPLIALLSCICLHTARAAPSTGLDTAEVQSNGERLARGLAPLKPRKLFSPSKTFSARAGIPSSSPPGTTVTGAAALYAPGTNGKRDSLLGYINGAGVLNSDGPDAWYNKWQFAVPSDASQAMNVKCPYYYRQDPIFCLGFSGGMAFTSVAQDGTKTWNSFDLTPTSTNYIQLFQQSNEPVFTGYGPSGSPATYASPPGGWLESKNWRIDPATGAASFLWVNLDGSQHEVTWCIARNAYGSGSIVAGYSGAQLTQALMAANSPPASVSNCGLMIYFETAATATN